jgi:ribosome-interacting GTPase 1
VLLVLDLADQETASLLENLLARLKDKRVELQAENPAAPPEPGRYRKRTLFIGTKGDSPLAADNLAFLKEYFGDKISFHSVSAESGDGLDGLRKEIFLVLDIIRVYSKTPGKKADFNEPFALPKGSIVSEMARAVHKDFFEKLKYARIWRKDSVALQGQMVNRDFILADEDVVELRI